MPIRQEDIFDVLKIICDDNEIYATTKESVKGGLIAGGTTVIGGLLFGPPGMLIGGGLGGLIAYNNAQQFKPVGEIILKLPQREKDILHEKVNSIIRHIDASDAVMLLALIRADQIVYTKILTFIKDFITSDLHMGMKC